MAKSKRGEVLKSLKQQMLNKGVTLTHYNDMLEDYMSFWDTKEALIKDIKTRGVMFTDLSAAGHEMMKNNPSVKEMVLVNKQMLSILKELKLSTDEIAGEDDDL